MHTEIHARKWRKQSGRSSNNNNNNINNESRQTDLSPSAGRSRGPLDCEIYFRRPKLRGAGRVRFGLVRLCSARSPLVWPHRNSAASRAEPAALAASRQLSISIMLLARLTWPASRSAGAAGKVETPAAGQRARAWPPRANQSKADCTYLAATPTRRRPGPSEGAEPAAAFLIAPPPTWPAAVASRPAGQWRNSG